MPLKNYKSVTALANLLDGVLEAAEGLSRGNTIITYPRIYLALIYDYHKGVEELLLDTVKQTKLRYEYILSSKVKRFVMKLRYGDIFE